MIRALLVLLAFVDTIGGQQKPKTPLEVAQALFAAMQAHDGKGARELFAPGAMLYSVTDKGKVDSMAATAFADRIASGKGVWLERIWNPKVLEQDTIAVVWADYDFHLDSKFSHCGVDSFSLVKADEGWKIAYISDTRKKSGCPPSPLGPPSPAH
jgi:hypothetical protein